MSVVIENLYRPTCSRYIGLVLGRDVYKDLSLKAKARTTDFFHVH